MLRQPEDGFGRLGRDRLIFETTGLPREYMDQNSGSYSRSRRNFLTTTEVTRRGRDGAARRIRITQPGGR